MSDNVCSFLLACLATCVALSPVACTMHADYLISQEIKSGTPPTMSMCAHSVSHPCPQLDVR